MNPLLKIHKEKPIKVILPFNEEQPVEITIDSVEEKKNILIIGIKSKNLEKFNFLTPNIKNHYIKKQLQGYFKLFSIEKEFDLHFID